MYQRLIWQMAFLMDKAGDGTGGGGAGGGAPAGGAGAAGGAGSGGNAGGGTSDSAKLVEALQASNKALEERLAKLEGKPAPGAGDGDDLAAKAAKEREAAAKKGHDTKQLENALKFTMGANAWAKTHEALLPKTIAGIMVAADKEIYDNAIDKDRAIKVGLVSEFFAQQANLDLLTESQKDALEEFKKLTKNDKQERVSNIFNTVFEPTFEMLKRVRKAEQVSKGEATPSDAETAYKEKLKAISKKTYLRR